MSSLYQKFVPLAGAKRSDMEWRPPDWVTLVPGAEIYIPGWMRFCVN